MMKKYHYGLLAVAVTALVYACTPKVATGIATTPTTPEIPKVATPSVPKNVVTPAGKRKFIDAVRGLLRRLFLLLKRVGAVSINCKNSIKMP
jgi:type IV secretory pathway protease TraF